MRTSKIAQLLNCRVKVTLQDGRVFIGQLLAHDKHLNFVLADCEEFRLLKRGGGNGTERRTLGMIVLRGEEVVSVSQESGAPPRGGNKARIPVSASTTSSINNNSNVGGIPPPGMAPMPPSGLAGPMPGMFIRPGMM